MSPIGTVQMCVSASRPVALITCRKSRQFAQERICAKLQTSFDDRYFDFDPEHDIIHMVRDGRGLWFEEKVTPPITRENSPTQLFGESTLKAIRRFAFDEVIMKGTIMQTTY